MNILIPHKWLLEHLDTDASETEIQKYVSLCGPSIERIYQTEGESVYDIEVTTNRVDSMSVRGIAREAAVILQQFDVKAQLKPKALIEKNETASELPLPKINNNPDLSKRVTCVVLSGIKRNPTPEWMGKRLLQTEQNIHDAAIDITNYITHELGHPCHAFDYDKLMNTGGVINIVEAKKGETFTTLDGNIFETVGGEVVFKNGNDEIIDLPSIKGTANTSVDDNTQNILLLLESIKAKKVRFASMTHAIRTTAAQLMEKNVDPNLAEDVLLRGIELYKELCNAQVASAIYDDFPGKKDLEPVEISLKRIREYLGIDIEMAKVVDIMEQLECRVEHNDVTVTVHPPTFRPDIAIPADIVEEIARIYGYHNLPSVLMDTPIPIIKQPNVNFTIEDRIKRHLSSTGLQEIYTYSMVSEDIAQETDSLENHLKILNPLSDDRVYMRKSLIPSLNEILDQNSNVHDLSVFEIANIYPPIKGDLPNERLMLSIVSTKDYRTVRGFVETLLSKFYLTNITVNQTADDLGEIIVENKTIGKVVVLSNERIAVEIDFVELLNLIKTHPTYQPIPKTGILKEDMTFTLPEKTAIGKVIETIKTTSDLVKSVELTDTYNQNYSFKISYHSKDQNLSTVKVEPVRKEIASKLKSSYNAILVGEV